MLLSVAQETLLQNVADRLINGSSGTIVYLFLGRKPLLGTIFVKFNNTLAGNSMKTYRVELKQSLLSDNSTYWFLYMQLLFTSHTGAPFTIGDFNRATDQDPNAVVVNKGQCNTLLSHVKVRDKVKLLNFDLSLIHCNENAFAKMEPMKDKSNICLFDLATSTKYAIW